MSFLRPCRFSLLSVVLVLCSASTLLAVSPQQSGERDNRKDKEAREAAIARGEITFDDIKFDIEKDAPFKESMLTEAIRKLDGKTVQLRGYILPSTLFSETNIKEFVLVRDNQECCFGPGAALYDCVIVNMVDGSSTDFTTRPVTVKGKFKYKPFLYPDGKKHYAVFNIEGVEVK